MHHGFFLTLNNINFLNKLFFLYNWTVCYKFNVKYFVAEGQIFCSCTKKQLFPDICSTFTIIHMILLVSLNFQTGDESSTDLNLFKMALREAYNRELEFYEQQEAQIVKQLAALENDRNQIRERKRSHIRCLVNVIACYRKKWN